MAEGDVRLIRHRNNLELRVRVGAASELKCDFARGVDETFRRRGTEVATCVGHVDAFFRVFLPYQSRGNHLMSAHDLASLEHVAQDFHLYDGWGFLPAYGLRTARRVQVFPESEGVHGREEAVVLRVDHDPGALQRGPVELGAGVPVEPTHFVGLSDR